MVSKPLIVVLPLLWVEACWFNTQLFYNTTAIIMPIKIDELVKSQAWDGKVKSSSSWRRDFREMRRSYVRCSEREMKRNAEIGLFTKPSRLGAGCSLSVAGCRIKPRRIDVRGYNYCCHPTVRLFNTWTVKLFKFWIVDNIDGHHSKPPRFHRERESI